MRVTVVPLTLLLVTALAGCSNGDTTEQTEETGSLVSMRVLTEHCETENLDDCGEVLEVNNDATWTLGENSGTLQQGYFIPLKEAVRTTGLHKAEDLQADCALDHGGVETVYSWTDAEGEPQLVRSCEKEISPEDPMVKSLDNLWADFSV